MATARITPARHKEAAQRPPSIGKIVARSMLVRTLRHGGLHHVLRAQPCIVGFVVADAGDRSVFVEAAKILLQELARDDFGLDLFDPDTEVLTFDGGKSGRSRDTDFLRDMLASRLRLFAFASDIEAFPPLFHAAADAILTPEPHDRRMLGGAAGQVLGYPVSAALLDAALGVPLSMADLIIRPGRSLRRTIRLLEVTRANGPTTAERSDGCEGPTLDDLHGLGEATEWGHAAARDFADYKAGRIGWDEMDRGILVSGPPGTGKTTFARALANTCLVPIHVHSLARWQAKGHLNDLLKAMRGAFDAARKDAPCILFIDELDSFGDRDTLSGWGEQYCREVINALLECLDGLEGREGVVVVGATNLPDKIDAAIRRPGRLDRHVVIPLPDLEARKGILRHHLRDALPGTDLTEAAERLEGASGAVLEQVVRDARRRARTDRRELLPDDLQAALPGRVCLPDETFRRACVHEAGHAVVGYLLADETGRTPVEVRVCREVAPGSAIGHTAYLRRIGAVRTRSGYLAEITGLLAGIAAEELVFGCRSDGGGGSEGSDLQQATSLATALEASLGLGDRLAYLSPRDDAELLSRLRADASLRSAVERTLGECLARASTMLGARRNALRRLSDHLGLRARASPEEMLAALGGCHADRGGKHDPEDSQGLAGHTRRLCPNPTAREKVPDSAS